jgi:HAD superfamily hydrolase (TIGR01509 family)
MRSIDSPRRRPGLSNMHPRGASALNVEATKLRFPAVVFDMDGTMFDSEILYYRSGVEMFRRRGLEYTQELALKIMGVPGREAMRLVKEDHQFPESPDELYNESQSILREMMVEELRLMPGLLELIDLLEAQGATIGVATSTERDLTEEMLTQFDLRRRFAFVLTRNDVQRGKPDPEIFLRACQAAGRKPQEVLVLEDSYNGTLAAKGAGCVCVAIPHELSRAIDFSHADLVADHLLDERLLALAGLSR